MLRGAIQDREKAKQLRDFTGLRFGNITPTDIDAFVEYKNLCYVVIEAKTGSKTMPYGQKLALERLCDDLQKAKPTLLILGSHNTPENEDVNYASLRVEKYRYKGKWKSSKKTTKELIESFLKQVEGKL